MVSRREVAIARRMKIVKINTEPDTDTTQHTGIMQRWQGYGEHDYTPLHQVIFPDSETLNGKGDFHGFFCQPALHIFGFYAFSGIILDKL